MSIKPETLAFLADLKVNNNREWFSEHKPRFKTIEEAFKNAMQELTEHMQRHDQIAETKVFRIYRDVRFSSDKSPYKAHLAGTMSRLGEDRRGGYYICVQPGESFIAAGFWNPEPRDLLRIRKEWEMDAEPLRELLANERFCRYWGTLEGEQLSRAPKGFLNSDPNLDLIRFKQFIFTRYFTDQEVLQGDWLALVDEHFREIRPFFDLMSQILTTNLNGESLVESE